METYVRTSIGTLYVQVYCTYQVCIHMFTFLCPYPHPTQHTSAHVGILYKCTVYTCVSRCNEVVEYVFTGLVSSQILYCGVYMQKLIQYEPNVINSVPMHVCMYVCTSPVVRLLLSSDL